MTGKPPGDEVGLYVDTRMGIDVGRIIVTPTGRAYEVVKARTQATGKHAGTRQHLRCVVLPAVPDGETNPITINWYARKKKRR